MKKIIRIGDTEYQMKSSAYTQFAYKNETGKSFLSDIQKIINFQNTKEENSLVIFEEMNEILLRIAYVMIKEADENQVQDYETFLKSIDSLNYSNSQILTDIIQLACNPLSGQLQTN